MKKTGIVLSILLVAMLLASCASAPPPAAPAPEPVAEEPPARRDLPQFFLNPPVYEDQIVGLGMAKMSSDSVSRQTAVARARTDIAFQMNTRVEAMLTDYFQEGGSGDDTQSITFVESISKQITNIDLKNAKTVEVYAAVDGNWFAMVTYPVRELVTEVENLFERNESAAFAEFKSDEALRRLDASLEDKPLTTTANEDFE
ncbi:MAG: LPP20 family lipoprotein [Spirochaetaceae bacterium]|nr:LPP20 family lipoprotein [Spirochaetaceae bacterium]